MSHADCITEMEGKDGELEEGMELHFLMKSLQHVVS